jgi:two-component sensor histidine kinase
MRRRRLSLIALAAWTVFAAIVVWWLPLQPDSTIIPDWIAGGDVIEPASVADRIGNWFKLLDVNFHGLYPFILLTPYVVWLATRFYLEEDRWRISLLVHLGGCALFIAMSDTLAGHIGSGRQIIVTMRSETLIGRDGTPMVITTGQTNLTRNFISRFQPPPLLGPEGHRPVQTNFADKSVRTGAVAWVEPGVPELRGIFLGRPWASQLLTCLLNIFGYAGIVGLAHAVHFYNRSRERERKASVLESQLTAARLRALQAQLHPHFLFNALNAISTLLRRDTRAAQEALTSFSELLRLALAHSSQPEVSLREDVEFLRRYVEIQQTRLGDRLRFEEEIDPAAFDCLVPALLLQPLVENAIRHGIEPSPDPGTVRVAIHQQNGCLLVTVEDNGAGLSAKEEENGTGTGIGLQNLRSRLETLYGKQQRVEVTTRNGGGVSVKVEIPLRRVKLVAEAAVTL